MTMRRGFRTFATLAVFAAVGLGLAGCVSEPARIRPGTSAAETLQLLGTPTGRYPLNGGGERLQYSRMPAGFEVTDIDVDASGKVVSVTQVLSEARFGQDIKVNQWRQDDVMAFYGRPYEISRVSSFDGAFVLLANFRPHHHRAFTGAIAEGGLAFIQFPRAHRRVARETHCSCRD